MAGHSKCGCQENDRTFLHAWIVVASRAPVATSIRGATISLQKRHAVSVDRTTYDQTIEVMRDALNGAHIDRSEKVKAFRRLSFHRSPASSALSTARVRSRTPNFARMFET